MSVGHAILEWFGLAAPEESTMPDGLQPHSRERGREVVTPEAALSLSTVFRGVQIHATALSQLSIGSERNGQRLSITPPLLLQPHLGESRSAFLEFNTVCLYLAGNAFWRLHRATAGAARPGEVVDIEPLNPHEVGVHKDFKTQVISYHYRGETIPAANMKHLKFLRVPGMLRGLGPIQAAQTELAGSIDARDYGSRWLNESAQPDGVLTTEQVVTPEQIAQYRNIWYGRTPDGKGKLSGSDNVNERLRVMGNGLSYAPIMLKPSDVQFLETQQFNTTQIARLLGVPASLLLAAVEGNSQTYSNVEQDWIAYVRFSLMKAIREIEEAFTDLLPRGQVARFNLDALLRTDTKTRMETHKVAIDAGVYDEDEARAIEGLAPRTPAQVAAAANRKKPAPAVESKP